jgi:hypothetical protein
VLEEVSAKSEMDQRYPELVRMAYLVLPGDRPRKYRLALARRIVDESLPQRAARNPGKAYVQVRTRVLARSMRPRWRLRIGLGRWLSALPVALPEDAQTDPLVELPPEVRAAYVLRTVEEMPYYVAHDQLVALGVRDARAALNEAAEVGEPAGPIAGLSVVRGPGRRPLLPVAVASVLTVVLIGGIVVTENRHRDALRRAAGEEVAMVGPKAWTHAAHTLAVWPARGDLVSNRTFIAAALTAWLRATALKTHDGAAGGPPHGRAQLLYAGRVDGTPVALLSDGGRVARYVQASGSPTTELFPAPRGGTTPLVLSDRRYLLPPWVLAARVSVPGRSSRPVTFEDGVAAVSSADTAGSAECAGGPVLALREPDGEHTVADLNGLALAEVRLPARPPACALPAPDQAVADAAVTEFWTGKLPGGVHGRWLCSRYTYLDGRTVSHATLFENGGDRHATGDCGDVRGGEVSGLWWHPGHGHWYYVAAASEGFKPQVAGKFQDTGREHGLLVAVGPKGSRRPQEPVTLTVRPR